VIKHFMDSILVCWWPSALNDGEEFTY